MSESGAFGKPLLLPVNFFFFMIWLDKYKQQQVVIPGYPGVPVSLARSGTKRLVVAPVTQQHNYKYTVGQSLRLPRTRVGVQVPCGTPGPGNTGYPVAPSRRAEKLTRLRAILRQNVCTSGTVICALGQRGYIRLEVPTGPQRYLGVLQRVHTITDSMI